MSELKELVMVNPSKKRNGKKKQAKKKAASRKSGARKASRKPPRRASRSTRRNPARKPRRSGAGRRRNPGIDYKGSLAALAGGALGYIVGQPAATLAGGFIQNKIGRGLAKSVIGATVPGGLGLLTQLMFPNVGKGMVGAGGALLSAHSMAAITQAPEKPIGVLEKAGFTQLGETISVYERDGQFFRRLNDGTEQLLLGAMGAQVDVETENGTEPALLLGTFESGGGIARTESGEFVLVEGALEERSDIAGALEERSDLGGDDDDTFDGDDGDDF